MPEQTNSLAALGGLHEFWEHWGFEPVRNPPFAGVRRKQQFIKSGLLGRLAEFNALDCILWSCGTAEDREDLWRTCTPVSEVMTQRFLFLLENPWLERRIRSFFWGFRGYLEFYAYWPGFESNVKVRDLSGLVDLGLGLLRESCAEEGDSAARGIDAQ
jgi:hypothetical protein